MISVKPRSLLIGMSCLLTLTACNAQEAGKPAAAKTETAAAPATPASPTGPVAIIVNGTPISQARIDFLVKDRINQGQPDSPELRNSIKESVIASELVAQEAAKKGLDKNPDFITQMELGRLSALAKAYVMDYLKSNPVSDDMLKGEYDRVKAQAGDKEYKARHILVKTEQEAKDIIAKLKKGEKFDKLAEKSEDPGSKGQGGDLGWFASGQMVKPFTDAVARLEKGKYTTEPVQTQFGWHVIKLDDTRASQVPPFEAVKDSIAQQMQQKQIEKLVTDLRTKAKVEEPGAAAEKKAPATEEKKEAAPAPAEKK